MKKNEITNLLSELLEMACEIMGRLIVELTSSFPALRKYITSLLFGMRELVDSRKI